MDHKTIRRVIPVIAVVHEGRMLLLQRANDSKYPNQWCIPGGKIEKNETPEQCAIRELREETGIDAAEFWMNLQTQHDLSKAAIAARDELAKIEPLRAA